MVSRGTVLPDGMVSVTVLTFQCEPDEQAGMLIVVVVVVIELKAV